MFNKLITISMLFLWACQQQVEKAPADLYATSLFKEVQLQAIFSDSKTFVDCTPARPLDEIIADYEKQKSHPDFNLKKFVAENFVLPDRPQSTFKTDTLRSMEEHLKGLWPVLTRKPDDYSPRTSLIHLPHSYVVPGGRFSEIYYWDSYFTMLGLKTQNRFDLIKDMVDNFAYLIDTIGFIPNGNRNYYLSRSQPPFFSLMVKLLAEKDPEAMVTYLPALQKEYSFWMNGETRLKKAGDAFAHVVMMSDGSIMNRYFDKRAQPRPEAFKEDVKVAQQASRNPEMGRSPEEVYTALRAAAESGWDFSSRWFGDGKEMSTIQTTTLIPVDLNCLLLHLEQMIMQGLERRGDSAGAAVFRKKVSLRHQAILRFCWDERRGYFFDYNFKKDSPSTVKSLAGVYPLFFNVALSEQAERVADVLQDDFLKPGGLVTTLTVTGQQWDAPNGWAPLQWMAYKGLKNYKHDALATEIKRRWIKQTERVYEATGKMMEKYNVMDTTLAAGGGEYPNQDGFGWTNGVVLALLASH